MSEIKVVVFDLGHTLVKGPSLAELLPTVFPDPKSELIGAEIDRTIGGLYTTSQIVQPRWQEVWSTAFAKFSTPYSEHIALAHLQRFVDQCELYEQTHAMLSRLRAMPVQLALLSNVTGPFELFDALLERLRLKPYFDSVHWSSKTGFRKPSNEAYSDVLRTLKVSADNALMVGDSELADVQGAKQMGMYAALVTDEASPKTQADCFTNHNDMANDVTRFVEHQH